MGDAIRSPCGVPPVVKLIRLVGRNDVVVTVTERGAIESTIVDTSPQGVLSQEGERDPLVAAEIWTLDSSVGAAGLMSREGDYGAANLATIYLELTHVGYVLYHGDSQDGGANTHPHPACGTEVPLTPLTHNMTIGTNWHRGLFRHVETHGALHLSLKLHHKAVVLGVQGSLGCC